MRWPYIASVLLLLSCVAICQSDDEFSEFVEIDVPEDFGETTPPSLSPPQQEATTRVPSAPKVDVSYNHEASFSYY